MLLSGKDFGRKVGWYTGPCKAGLAISGTVLGSEPTELLGDVLNIG